LNVSLWRKNTKLASNFRGAFLIISCQKWTKKSKPRLASSNAFSIEDETERYPEVKAYENVLFDPVDFDCGLTEGSFTDFDLKKVITTGPLP
jgi:hypothetical protein